MKSILLFLLLLFLDLTSAQIRYFQKPLTQNEFEDSNWIQNLSSSWNFGRILQGEEEIYEEQNNTDIPGIRTVSIYGNSSLGYYFIDLFFGALKQRQSLIIDTGSTITCMPCQTCGLSCGSNHLDIAFNTELSNTYEPMENGDRLGNYQCSTSDSSCTFGISYTEGSSYSGYYGKDFVNFGNEIEDHLAGKTQIENFDQLYQKTQFMTVFGCVERETDFFYTQAADGILGLGVSTNMFKVPPSIVQSYKLQYSTPRDAFSICYAPDGGYMSIGGYNLAYHVLDDEVETIPYHTEHNQYRVHLNRVDFEGEKLELSEAQRNSGEGAFFDSGTTLFYAAQPIYDLIQMEFHEFCKLAPNCGNVATPQNCYSFEKSGYDTLEGFFESFPSMTFYFGDSPQYEGEYELRGEDYMYLNEAGRWCVGIQKAGAKTVLGGTFMRNHDILFDRENKRMAFVRANCSGLGNSVYPIIIRGDIPVPDRDSLESAIQGSSIQNKVDNFLAILIIFVLLGIFCAILVTVRSIKRDRLQNFQSIFKVRTPPTFERFDPSYITTSVESQSLASLGQDEDVSNPIQYIEFNSNRRVFE